MTTSPKTAGTLAKTARRLLAAAAAALLSCTPSDVPPELEVTATPRAALPDASPRSLIESLDAAIHGSRGLAADVADVRAMLEAEDAERRGDATAATSHWLEALRLAQGRFGQRALEGWLKSYVGNLGKQSDRLVLARLVLAETRGGSISPYMTARSLTSDAALIPILETTVPQWLTDDATTLVPGIDAPRGGIPSDDPLLVDTAKSNCKAGRNRLASWQSWTEQLGPELRLYWEGLVLQCAGRSPEAIDKLRAAAKQLGTARTTQALAVEALGRVAAMERAVGRRTEAADTYRELMKAWDAPGVTPKSMGLEDTAFGLRRVDEALWASRYRSMVSDYENSKLYAQAALNLISNIQTMTTRSSASATVREQLATLRAEAYHVLAYRIAIEQREFESATAMNVLALQTPNLNREWRERLSWFAGVYEYLAGNHESAKRKWEALLSQTKDDSLRAMLYFWLAKIHDHLGQREEARFYLSAITEDFPLSFYAVVAPQAGKLAGGKDWRATFGSPRDLARRLEAGRDYGIAKLRTQGELGRLLRRAELFAAAELGPFYKLAVDELEPRMNTDLVLEANVGAFVYLTRLQYDAGSYLKAIALSTKVARAVPGFWQQWPEQLLIYFPRPFDEDYARNAQETALDKSLLLAISRQESGFTPDIKSSAAAIGIMQLIHPTAARFASEVGLPTDDLDGLLRNPSANIKLGSRYLKFLTMNYKGFEPAIYGGYNAGEYAVDLWLKRRAHSDPLMFVELVPFGETKDYIKNVWRNVAVYKYLESEMGGGLERFQFRPRDSAR